MAVRNVDKATPLADEIRRQVGSGSGKVDIERVDIADLDSVRAFATKFLSEHNRLDVLINNAGIMMPDQLVRSPQGLDPHMAANHHGHVLLTSMLLPLLSNTPGSRVVNVSSTMHKYIRSVAEMKTNIDSERGYEKAAGYGRSKLANILFTLELDRRLKSAGVEYPMVLAAHPGITETNLQHAEKSGFMKFFLDAGNVLIAQSVEMGGLIWQSLFFRSCAELEII